jgi:hypothetical protein
LILTLQSESIIIIKAGSNIIKLIYYIKQVVLQKNIKMIYMLK